MSLNSWAIKWGVSFEALAELRASMGDEQDAKPSNVATGGEAAVQNAIRLEATKKGCRIWRNNVGACMDSKGNFIRYGIANDSAGMNKRIKSSDLIGIRPVLITQDMVGETLGQFIAREVKAPGWVYKGTERELAQYKFIKLVTALGGDARFAREEGTL